MFMFLKGIFTTFKYVLARGLYKIPVCKITIFNVNYLANLILYDVHIVPVMLLIMKAIKRFHHVFTYKIDVNF